MKVVFLGCTHNYSFGFSADITKISYMAKGLAEAGADCVIHNGIVGSDKVTNDQTVLVDDFPVTTYKKRGNQLFSFIRNIRKTYKYVKNEKEKNGRNIAITIMPLYHIYITYWIICKILGYKYVVISHEWGTTLNEKSKLKICLQSLFAKTFGYFANGILPISEYIIEKIEHFKKPYFKVPILAEFNDGHNKDVQKNNTMVYCAAVYYKRIILMLIDSYKIYAKNNGELNLTLILNGPNYLIEEIQKYIDSYHLEERIIIKTKLPYKDLIKEYQEARALIIPLNPDYEQDKARFSQKIAEYLSSKSPILTNKVGEINYYFKENEIITCGYNDISFADAFKWIENHKEECSIIGENGYKRGEIDFNYKTVGEGMYNFLQKL